MLEKLLATYPFELSHEELETLTTLGHIFHEKNQLINLSAIRDLEGIYSKHIIDSLHFSIVSGLLPEIGGRILDIGTGGGFPGLPIAITHPNVHVTLLDTRKKKITCIEEFITTLTIPNATGSWGRAEEIKYHEKFDIVVSRATAYMPTMLSWSKRHLKKGGYCVMMKQFTEEEDTDGRSSAHKAGFTFIDMPTYKLEGQERVIYIFEKR